MQKKVLLLALLSSNILLAMDDQNKKIDNNNKYNTSEKLSSNLEKSYFAQVCDIKEIQEIISDYNMSWVEVKKFKAHSARIKSLEFSPDNTHLASASWDDIIKIWDTNNYERIRSLPTKRCYATYSPDNKFLAANSNFDRNTMIFNVRFNYDIDDSKIAEGKCSNSLKYSPDNKFLATTANYSHNIKILDTVNYNLLNTLTGHSTIPALAFSRNSKYLASADATGTIKIWNTSENFKSIHTLEKAHNDAIYSLGYSPDNKHLASASWDKTVKIWDTLNNYTLLQTLSDHTNMVNVLAYSPDNKFLATGGDDRVIRIWSVKENYKLLCTIEALGSGLISLAFSQDSNFLASGSEDGTIIIWQFIK